MAKFCNQCGAKLESSYKFCPECGTKFSGSKNVKQNSESVKNVSDSNEKNLNPKVLYGILGGGIVIILLILFFTGSFESEPVVDNTVMQNQQTGTTSGVNMNNMKLINDLEAQVKANPDDYNSLLQLAHLRNDSGMFEAAIKDYKTYLDKNPKDADARVDLGVCYFNLQDFTNAIKEMETALKYVSDHQIAHLNLGVVNLSAGNVEKSKEWLQKAYNLNPTNEIGKKAEQLLKNH